MYLAMNAPTWMQRVRHNKEIADRKKFWAKVIPKSKLVYVEQETGVLGLHIETFQLLDGMTFEDARSQMQSIRTNLKTNSVCICPVGVVLDSGDENNGTIGLEGFRIVWSDNLVLPSLFDSKITQHERDFITRLELMPKLTEDSVIGYCPLLHSRMVTEKDSSEKVIVISLVSRSGAHIEDFSRVKSFIQEKYHARLVEFSNDGEFDSSMIVSIIISAKDTAATGEEISFITTGTIPVVKGISSAQQLITREI